MKNSLPDEWSIKFRIKAYEICQQISDTRKYVRRLDKFLAELNKSVQTNDPIIPIILREKLAFNYFVYYIANAKENLSEIGYEIAFNEDLISRILILWPDCNFSNCAAELRKILISDTDLKSFCKSHYYDVLGEILN